MSEQTLPAGEPRIHDRATEEIRVVLARRKMSAADLARRIGTKPQVLSRRMTGDVAFDLDELQIIARELGVSVAALIGETGADEQTTARYRHHVRYWPEVPEETIPHQPNGQHGAIVASSATRRPARMRNAAPREPRMIGPEVVPA